MIIKGMDNKPTSKGPVINSSRGGGGRHLGGGPNSTHSEGRRMKNKEHFKRRTMEFLLKFWSGDKNIYISLRGGTKIPLNI